MTAYKGPVKVLNASGAELESVHAELWSMAGGAELIWGGELSPMQERFRSGLEGCRGQTVTLMLSTGQRGHCQIEKVRATLPQLLRIEGVGPAPFV